MNVHIVNASSAEAAGEEARHTWTRADAQAIYDLPFNDLLFRAATVHRRHFDPNEVQLIAPAVHQDRRLRRGLRLLQPVRSPCLWPQGLEADGGASASSPRRKKAKAQGATRYCMGAAWRSPKARDMEYCVAMVEGVKALGMETCMTLGMLSDDDVVQAQGRRPRLLQPQHRYVRALLLRGHHHAHVRRSPRDAGARARGRHQGLLRRHRRHGRDGRRPRRHAGHAGQSSRARRRACRSTC